MEANVGSRESGYPFSGGRLMDRRFSKSAFLEVENRNSLLDELRLVLSARKYDVRRFHEDVLLIIDDLRTIGHYLWSYDYMDDIEVWGPDYMRPVGPGILLTFRRSGEVDVEWSAEDK